MDNDVGQYQMFLQVTSKIWDFFTQEIICIVYGITKTHIFVSMLVLIYILIGKCKSFL